MKVWDYEFLRTPALPMPDSGSQPEEHSLTAELDSCTVSALMALDTTCTRTGARFSRHSNRLSRTNNGSAGNGCQNRVFMNARSEERPQLRILPDKEGLRACLPRGREPIDFHPDFPTERVNI